MSGLAVERAPWRNQSAARARRGRAESARPRLTLRGSWRERLARRAVMACVARCSDQRASQGYKKEPRALLWAAAGSENSCD
jgi:hypothetical protein